MVKVHVTVADIRSLPGVIFAWLSQKVDPVTREWLDLARQPDSPPPPQPQPEAPAQPATPRIVESGRVIIPAARDQVNQMNSPAWMAAGFAPTSLAAAQAAAPVVPSAVPPMATTAPPINMGNLFAAPVQAEPVRKRDPNHLTQVIFPQLVASRGADTLRQVLTQSGISHVSHITAANVDAVAGVIKQVTGVDV